MNKIIGGTTSTPMKPTGGSVDLSGYATKDNLNDIVKINNLNRYDLHYYSTISKAASDITNESLTKADSDVDNAEVCVWLDDNECYNIMLLKDVTISSCSFGAPDTAYRHSFKLILNGKTFNGRIELNGRSYIDGTKAGSKITETRTYGGGRLVSAYDLTINGGTYESIYNLSSTNTSNVYLFRKTMDTSGNYLPLDLNISNATCNLISNGNTNYIVQSNNLVADNCTFNITSTTATTLIGIENAKEGIINNCAFNIESESATDCRGISNDSDSNLIIENSIINTKSNICNSSYGVCNFGTLTLNNTTVYADAPNNGYANDNVSKAIYNAPTGTLIINNGKYTGTHTGVSSKGNLFVDGGIFISCSHGGMYLSGGVDKEIFIKNATIGCEEYSGKYDFSTMENGYLGAFYIGGNTGDEYCNTSVYMDNCILLPLGAESAILRNSNGEHDNKLYISNTIIPDGKKVRNGDGNYLYIGLGTNITSDNVFDSTLENYSYTKEEYTFENQYTNKRVGDIETALDEIIEIQNSLIGGNA